MAGRGCYNSHLAIFLEHELKFDTLPDHRFFMSGLEDGFELSLLIWLDTTANRVVWASRTLSPE